MDADANESRGSHAERRRPLPISLESPETLRALVDTMAEGTYVCLPDGGIVDANPALLRIVGAESVEELEKHSTGELWPDRQRRADFVREVIERGAVAEFELDLQRIDGAVVTVVDTCCAQKQDGEVVALYGVMLDITQRKTLEAQFGQLSVRDPVTGCYNRRYLQARQPDFERPSYFYGCVVVDLDELKHTNENFGREEGDRVLQRFAHFIIRNKRADDTLVRLDDDEFALFVEVARPHNLELISRRLVENASAQAPVAFSIGHAYRQPGEKLEQILARADASMYEAKGRRAADRDRRRDQPAGKPTGASNQDA